LPGNVDHPVAYEPVSDPRSPETVSMSAFGRDFLYLYPEEALNLRTIEDEGLLYSEFVDPGGSDDAGFTGTRYKIRLKPREIYEYVDAALQHDEFLQRCMSGVGKQEAVDEIASPLIRQRVLDYARHAANFPGTGDEIYVCLASFYSPELEDLLCGGRPDRYEPSEVASDPTTAVIKALSAVVISARRLRTRRAGRQPFELNDEYDVQDLAEVALSGVFDDVVREDATPMRADGHHRVDFSIPSIRTLIEIKYLKRRTDIRKVSDELRADMIAYASHSIARRLFLYTYDPSGYIANRDAFSRQFNGLHIIGGNELTVYSMVDG
jgi:hypothetical protein